MDWLSFCYALLFLVITPFALQSNNKENTENLIKLYMLYDLTNNLPKELEIINKIKNFDLEQYYLLITKYYINEEEIKKILNNEKNIDVKIIYQIFSLIKFKNKKLATKIKNLILTNYPKSIYSYKIKRNE